MGRAQPRRAAKVDSTAATITGWLEKAGAVVVVVGHPFDAFVGWKGTWHPVDFKAPGGSPTMEQTKEAVRFARNGLPELIFADTSEGILEELRRRQRTKA